MIIVLADMIQGKVLGFGLSSYDLFIYLVPFYSFRYQDVHNQSYIIVKASARWLGVRLDLLTSMLIGAVSLAAVLVSQDAG